MKIDSYRNRFGHIRFYKRKRFLFFGKKMYYVSGYNRFYGSNIKHRTFVCYENAYTAKRIFDIIKSTLMLEEDKI